MVVKLEQFNAERCCDRSEHGSANFIVCLSAGACLMNTDLPSDFVSPREAIMHACRYRNARTICSERWITRVDQGWIRVDRGGSEVDHCHLLVPSLRETCGNVREQGMAADSAAGVTCAFI